MEKDNIKKDNIKKLQELSESVLKLKQEYRQKRPIVIEFSGSPKAGKTSCINSLELFLKRNGFSVKIIQERASVCPVSDKQSPMFNVWTACSSLSGMIGTIEDKKNNIDVLILDRGIFDSLCWFEWLVSNARMEEEWRNKTKRFFLSEEFVKKIDIVFVFSADPKVSIEREYAALLTDKLGSIMNEAVLRDYNEALSKTISKSKEFFHKVFQIDTSKSNQNEVGEQVTTITLTALKDLLMEHIAYFEKSENIRSLLEKKDVFLFDEIKNEIGEIKFDVRDAVENNRNLIQPLPVAVIANKDMTKVLVVKKQSKSTSQDSPEKDKLLTYAGGHIRKEDRVGGGVNLDFLSLCKSALKREIKEELGISIAIDDSFEPKLIYAKDREKSKQHLAVCFLILLDDENSKFTFDTQELISNKGKSKSGRFLSMEEICKEEENLETWSKIILKEMFAYSLEAEKQITVFDLNL